jgi:hypothetical protein
VRRADVVEHARPASRRPRRRRAPAPHLRSPSRPAVTGSATAPSSLPYGAPLGDLHRQLARGDEDRAPSCALGAAPRVGRAEGQREARRSSVSPWRLAPGRRARDSGGIAALCTGSALTVPQGGQRAQGRGAS